jgi:hypothetical protein
MRAPESGGPLLALVIGAQKAGTTSLHAALGSLPEVSTSRHGKEIDFFSRHFDRGMGWYLAHFDPARSVWLDVSPNYMAVADLDARLASLTVRHHCVLIVRDPLERARSQHRHCRARRPDTTPAAFAEALAANPTYVTNGLYGELLHRCPSLLRPGALSVLWFEDLVSQPAEVLDAVCGTLGLAGRPRASVVAAKANASGPPRSRAAFAVVHGVGRGLRRLGGERAVSYVRRSPVATKVMAANRRPDRDGDDVVPDAVRAELAARFLPDLERAQALSGLPFADRYRASLTGASS